MHFEITDRTNRIPGFPCDPRAPVVNELSSPPDQENPPVACKTPRNPIQ